MEIKLVRDTFTQNSTIGRLFVDGAFECFILEDVVRAPNVKIPDETAIPYGRYEVIVSYSNRFKQQMPLLLNVPMYEGVRIHSGNVAEHTEGCLLTGKTVGKDVVGGSRVAYQALFSKISKAVKKEKVFIEIVSG